MLCVSECRVPNENTKAQLFYSGTLTYDKDRRADQLTSPDGFIDWSVVCVS